MSARSRLRWYSLALDVALALLCYEFAVFVFGWFHHTEMHFWHGPWDWGIPADIASVVITFLWLGLYQLEAYISRPLHVLTVAKGSLIALVVTSFAAFTLKAPIIADSRLTIFTAFAAFFIADCVLRVWLLDRLFRRDVRRCPGGTVVIGEGSGTSHVAGRCRELRGFAPVTTLEPMDKRRNGFDAEPALLHALSEAESPPRRVFLDGASLGHKATFDLIAAARQLDAEVYVVGRIVSPLDATRMLLRLFEMPVMRVRHVPWDDEQAPTSKRAFDVVAAVLALALLAPAIAVIAVLVKRDSPGPVFYRQTRVGLRGRPFDLLKFRSMTVGNDASGHQDYVCRLISGDDGLGDATLLCTDEWGRPVYKLAEDDRVTRVGRVLRKYSLDELPQLWNVLRGDMSMVGPRPALAYEVAVYKPWHLRRLDIMPGVSGLWQVAGRSRVAFDEMVFQDIIYSYDQSLLTDISICLRTVPAMVIGRGAA